ncbi:hypothetical protein FN846DRAFT_894921 [Sphaerosporella brunnea]|uniref:Uncharacterized protein n=1 Tax=Sphaerosporella brunnea TaxID=1250544 RepID=A0A5J5EH56_9PEZI|nr:hypothetical protein FN846DRAFT_894921 [Sphaerosporella brunnea]
MQSTNGAPRDCIAHGTLKPRKYLNTQSPYVDRAVGSASQAHTTRSTSSSMERELSLSTGGGSMESDTKRHSPEVTATNQSPSRTRIVNLLKSKATTAFIAEGLTGHLQSLDTHVSKSVKQYISDYLEEKIEEDSQSDFPGTSNVRVQERRILVTRCVADAWKNLHNEQGDLIRKPFQQNGIAFDPYGSGDHLLKVKDLPDHATEIGGNEVRGAGGLNCH